MGRVILIVIFLGLATRAATALAPGFAPVPGGPCGAAIQAAEQGHGIPAQLLAAIGQVESGRRDPDTGVRMPWPWTINAEGEGFFFNSKAEALAAVRGLQARGVRSIDVGCMQVNLMHHPTAFASLEAAFEPAINADYAARFLADLHAQSSDWMKATASYHSANPAEGEPYAAQVGAIWPEEQRKAGLAPTPFATTRPGMTAPTMTMPFSARQPPRMLALPPSAGPTPAGTRPGQSTVAGHGLDFYRAMPLRLATRGPLLSRIPAMAVLR